MNRALVVVAVLLGTTALAQAREGDRVVRVKVVDATKTDTNTVQDIAGVSEGDVININDLEIMKQRLLGSGLFKEVDVRTEKAAGGVSVVISAKDKVSWFIAPTFSYSENSYGGGIAFGETNLFGWHKKLLLYGAMSNTTGSLAMAYLDPSIRGSWAYYQLDGFFQKDQVYEYAPVDLPTLGIKRTTILRSTNLQTAGAGVTFGVRWWRKLKTEGRLAARGISYDAVSFPDTTIPADPALQSISTGAVGSASGQSTDGVNVNGRLTAGWDSRSSVHGVQSGFALLGTYEGGLKALGSDYAYWKAQLGMHWALRLFQEHNFIVRASAVVARDEPFFEEYESGGSTFRGYLTRQFRGDTRGFASAEYVFPIVKLGGLHVRGLVFFDSNITWFGQQPYCRPPTEGPSDTGAACPDGYAYAERRAGDQIRYYLPGEYFSRKREAWNNGVGGGLRFYLKSIAMPLVGVDYGYGIEGKLNQVYLTVGLVQ
ncbi:MAG TPA: BamA/TamA family outer membrane protein [Polyangia bacterium]|jgi:outer membrane protein assembly factor BamA